MESPTARWRDGRQADRPAGGRQAPPNIKAEVPSPAFAANNIHRGKKERRGGEGGSYNSEALPDSTLVICR